MKVFKVTYDGFWLGGKAIVIAKNETDAVNQVRDHDRTAAFNNVKVTELPAKGVLYNDNGDY